MNKGEQDTRRPATPGPGPGPLDEEGQQGQGQAAASPDASRSSRGEGTRKTLHLNLRDEHIPFFKALKQIRIALRTQTQTLANLQKEAQAIQLEIDALFERTQRLVSSLRSLPTHVVLMEQLCQPLNELPILGELVRLEKAWTECQEAKERKGADPSQNQRLAAAIKEFTAADEAYQIALSTSRELEAIETRIEERPTTEEQVAQPPPEPAPPAPPAPPEPPPDPLLAFAVVKTSRGLLERIALLIPDCQQGWPEAGKALLDLQKGLQWLDQGFRELTPPGSEEEWRQQLEARAPRWADEHITVLRRLDELLSGKNEKGEDLTGLTDRSLQEPLREVRNQLLDFIVKYGGWEEYPLKVGDQVANHRDFLEPVGTRARTSGPATVRAILHPGYRRKRDGLPKKARVFLSG